MEREYVLVAIPIALIFLVIIGLMIYTFYPKPFEAIFEFAGESLHLAKTEENEKAALAAADVMVNSFADCLRQDNQRCSCKDPVDMLPPGYTIVIDNKDSGASIVALDKDEVALSTTTKTVKDLKIGVAVMQKAKQNLFGKESDLLELGCIFPENIVIKGSEMKPLLSFEGKDEPLLSPSLIKVDENSMCILSASLLRSDYHNLDTPGFYRRNTTAPYIVLDYYEHFLRSSDDKEKRIVLNKHKEAATGIDENLGFFTSLFTKEVMPCGSLVWPLKLGKAESCKGVPGLMSNEALVNSYTFSAAEESDVFSIVSGKIKGQCAGCAVKFVEVENDQMNVRYSGFTSLSAGLKEDIAKGQNLGEAQKIVLSILDHEGNMVNPFCLLPESSDHFLDSCRCEIYSVYPKLLKEHPAMEDCNPAPLERAVHCSALLA